MTWIDGLGLFGALIIILLANVSTWLIYGIVKEDFAIILANSIILSLSLLLLYFKLSFKKSQ